MKPEDQSEARAGVKNPIIELIELLKISEDEALRALISTFTPYSPGSLRQKWLGRKGYGRPPSTRKIWEIFSKADFRCQSCSSQLSITLDHIDNNTLDSRPQNLQVLCADCNRAKGRRGMIYRNAKVRIYKTILEFWKKHKRFPTDIEIKEYSGIKQLNAACYMIRFFEARLSNRIRPMRTRREIK